MIILRNRQLIKNDFLEEKMDAFLKNVLKKDDPENDWNALQKFMSNNRNKNIVVVAQTGYGKTEAGLLWIGNNKGFFTCLLYTSPSPRDS